MLQMSPIGMGIFNGVTWYISVLLICSYFIRLLLDLAYDLFVYGIAPFAVICIYGYFYHTFGTVHIITQSSVFPFVMDGVFRGVAGMCLGVISHQLWNKVNHSRLKEKVFSILQISGMIGLLFVIVASFLKASSHLDFYYIFLLSWSIVALSFDRGNLGKLFSSRLFLWLGSLSYPIYLNQYLIENVYKKFFSSYPNFVVFPSLVIVTILYAIVTQNIVNKIAEKIMQKSVCLFEK